jgi:hypothetical protein
MPFSSLQDMFAGFADASVACKKGEGHALFVYAGLARDYSLRGTRRLRQHWRLGRLCPRLMQHAGRRYGKPI